MKWKLCGGAFNPNLEGQGRYQKKKKKKKEVKPEVSFEAEWERGKRRV